MKKKKLTSRGLLVYLTSCLFLLAVAGCTRGTLDGAAMGTGVDAGGRHATGNKGGVVLGDTIGGLAGGALGSEATAQKEQASSTKISQGPLSEETAAHNTYDSALEFEKHKIEVERQRIELEKEKLELEKAKQDLSH
ncbi:MAG: hypothetical protein LBE98_03035 [Puniceicoccales bacterium]|nr:hypothetical protein [Puniceicoccales bacterium]